MAEQIFCKIFMKIRYYLAKFGAVIKLSPLSVKHLFWKIKQNMGERWRLEKKSRAS